MGVRPLVAGSAEKYAVAAAVGVGRVDAAPPAVVVVGAGSPAALAAPGVAGEHGFLDPTSH